MDCISCGAEYGSDSTFCVRCGIALNGIGSSAFDYDFALDPDPAITRPATHCTPTQAEVPAMMLTDEQAKAVQLFHTSSSLKISAFAGTGKTSTLVALARSTPKKGVYLAFNKSIATAAKNKFPRSVHCTTIHSLAFRAMARTYQWNKAKLTKSLHGNYVARLLDLEEIVVGETILKPRSLGFLVAQTIQRFCHSGADEIGVHHVPLSGGLQRLDPKYRGRFKEYLSDLAAHLWDRMRDPATDVPLGHDGYLKLWSLSKPKLAYDFILLDEAQDTNEVVLSVLRHQESHLTIVGDRHQQIYEWRGAINAMASLETDAETALTRSFRFGDSVAAAATSVLRMLGETRSVVGDPNTHTRISSVGRTDAILCRTNAGVVSVVVDALGSGDRLHVVGGVADLIRMLEDVSRLKGSIPAESPEFFDFANWSEVVDFAETDEGEYLRSFVNIVLQHGEVALIEQLGLVCPEEAEADLIVSTVHKAKGREWDAVGLCSDFQPPLSKEEPSNQVLNDEEARLLYVAITRARKLLVVPAKLAAKWNIPGVQALSAVEAPVVPPPPSRPPAKPRPELPGFARRVDLSQRPRRKPPTPGQQEGNDR